MAIINADGLILGRLASIVAKRLLLGEEIAIVNIEKAVISGSEENIFKEYKAMRDKGSREKGPYFPRMPDQIMKRTIRGMLPYRQKKGREALARLRIYIGIPDELKSKEKEFESIELASMSRLSSARYMTLGEVSKMLGAKF
ncbi:MAG: 50S ribosomal protein L13 [Methanocellales archaeon]